jgi:raffinose/stachyose/melibiose transport system permease protein
MSTTQASYYDRRGIMGTLGRDGLLQIILIANTVLMLANFLKIWNETNFLRYLLNSFVVTGASMVLILTLGTMAAYALGRYAFTGSNFILMFFLAGLTLPLKLAIIPLFMLMRDLSILNNQLSLIFVYTAMGLPTTVFIMTGFIRSLPSELEDAARMDGASEARIMWSIMLPLVRPAMVIAGIQNVVPIWNDFFFPLVFIQNDDLKTLPQGLTNFMGEYTTDWGVLFSGLTLSAAPIIIIYIVLSKQFIAGMTSGAVK